MDTKAFLSTIYRKCTEGYITLTFLPERKTLWFKVNEIDKISEAAQKYGTKTNTFFGVGLIRKVLQNNLRGSENDILTITTLYADIDVRSNAHAETALPCSTDEAIEFLNSLPLKPSIIVNSGNGLHAYWLLDTPFKIQSAKDKDYITSIFKGWSKFVNANAKERGWKLDNVSDLARVLRVPGSINHKLKNGSICEVLGCNRTRCHLSEFEAYMGNSEANHERVQNKSQRGDAKRIIEKCDFIRYCKENAKNLPEPYWHVMVTNLAPTKDGTKLVHELSRPYPKYNKSETERKIRRAISENKPHTCRYIHDHLGFECSRECGIKAPIVHGIPSIEQRFIDLIESKELTPNEIFSKENMKLCAFAKTNMPSEYARLKTKLKGKVNLRDFEKAVRYEGKPRRGYSSEKTKRLDLKHIELNGCIQPPGWDVSMNHGVRKILQSAASEELIPVCSCPLIISRRFENIDDGTQKIEIKFYRDAHWKSVIASRSHIFNRTSVIKYADSGLPVSSGNASDIVKYLSDYENTNEKHIPLVKSISRMGWVVRDRTGQFALENQCKNKISLPANKSNGLSLEFFPYFASGEIIFENEYKKATSIIESTNECGSFEVWQENAKVLRSNPYGRFLLAASFASPLLEILKHRVFFVHIWHDSKSGKTAAIKMAISIWGNPVKLMGSFNATSVGLERMAGILKHLPFAIDELQVLNNRRLSVENIIYSLGNGFGRLRGAKEGSIQETVSWRNNVITSGEQPMSKESSNDGVLTRVLELYGKPTENENTAHTFHLVSENNYGFAGRNFLKYLINEVLKTKGKVQRNFENLRKSIRCKCAENCDNSHLDNVAVVCLGDYYSSMCVFGERPEIAWNEAIELGTKILENCEEFQKSDTIERAWDFVTGWIASNKNRFSPDSTPCFGKIEEDMVYVIPNILREALEENGFDYSKVTRGFKERGYIETRIDNKGHSKMQISKMINGIVQKCFCIKEVINPINNDCTNPLK